MTQASSKERNSIEEDAWVTIDSLIEQNKTRLAGQIESGM